MNRVGQRTMYQMVAPLQIPKAIFGVDNIFFLIFRLMQQHGQHV